MLVTEMRVMMLPPDNLVVVDGAGMRIDLSAITGGITRIEWDGVSGQVFRGAAVESIDSLSPYQWAIDAVNAEVDARAARAADQFYGLTPEAAVAMAAGRVLAALDSELAVRLAAPVVVSGHTYYADAWGTKTLESALVVAQVLGQADTDPVRVPPPLQPGYWLTADLDASGNRVVAPITVGDLKPIIVTMYDRNGLLWGKKMIHEATIAAMIAGGATAQQVSAYDISQGWT